MLRKGPFNPLTSALVECWRGFKTEAKAAKKFRKKIKKIEAASWVTIPSILNPEVIEEVTPVIEDEVVEVRKLFT